MAAAKRGAKAAPAKRGRTKAAATPERARKAAAKKPPPKKAPAKKAAPAKKPAKLAAPGKAVKPARPREPRAPVERFRVVVPMDVYEPNKDAVKAPLKERGLKWTFLGQGQGLYKREDGGVHCFTQFKDDGVHYSLWGEDKAARDGILADWRRVLGEERFAQATASGEQAAAAEKRQEESEALRLWRLAEPQRRPGEPDFFFQKRMAEWQAKRPA